MAENGELNLAFQDQEWPFLGTDHNRDIVRAVVVDAQQYFYFVRVRRDDDFGRATLIETSGGGVEKGEDLITALRRELHEELGAEVEVLSKIGIVQDDYNLIRRHNINHYFLCRVKSFGRGQLTEDEIGKFHLSTLRLSFREAVNEYEICRQTRLGRLIAQRELPVLNRAWEILNGQRNG